MHQRWEAKILQKVSLPLRGIEPTTFRSQFRYATNGPIQPGLVDIKTLEQKVSGETISLPEFIVFPARFSGDCMFQILCSTSQLIHSRRCG